MNFSAVILAGGKSSRMGRDKSQLMLAGETLLERQVKLARTVGAQEVFISTPSAIESKRLGCVGVRDRFADCGPLAGIESALTHCHHGQLLVLAVDMPQVDARILLDLLGSCTPDIGVVSRVAGRIEPLVAIYPKATAALATELLLAATPGLNPGACDFASICVARNWARFADLPATVANAFKSWNEPHDVSFLSPVPPTAPADSRTRA